MRSYFSKPSDDIAKESFEQLESNDELLARQRRISRLLEGRPVRRFCLICGRLVEDEDGFTHRTVQYVKCPGCGHVQSRALPPEGYPERVENGLTFSRVYPRLEKEKYESRKNRIYRPKLDWILDCHRELGKTREEIIQLKWLEMGCGAGYFLSALADIGANRILGVEENRNLVDIAGEMVGTDVVRHHRKSLAEAVRKYPADIYVAFFVLEHLEHPDCFFLEMKSLPPGTVFVFAVPVFGFASFLESAVDGYFARNLENVLHTQLYTDESIEYFLREAGYQIVSQWVFGQDSADLLRMLMILLRDKYSKSLLDEVRERTTKVLDPLQQVLDRHLLSDSRHILAVKES